jgi:hypothetical protein
MPACAEAVNVLPSCLTRDEGHFVWCKADYVTVLFVARFDPSDDGTIAYVKDVWETTGSCQERTRDVFQWMEEDVVYSSVDGIQNCLSDFSHACQDGK